MHKENKKAFWQHFEFRVILLLICVTTAIAILFYQLILTQFNSVLINDLKEDAKIIHDYVEELIEAESFEQLNTIEDESKECYVSLHEQLDQIRRIANIRYLYTAKKNDKGEYIYVIDGLDRDAEDFRHIGMLIEDEIIPELEKCLDNQIVLSDEIFDTDWGIVYVAYFPVHDEQGYVIGAIGMEFDMETLYRSLQRMRLLSTVICILILVIFLTISIILLRRVSEPFYKKMAYTDIMTNMKNRTAFEMEMKNLESNLKNEDKIGIIIYDLNNLKLINDRLGHSAGDVFIKKLTGVLLDTYGEFGTCYRIGGDEFAVLTVGKNRKEVLSMMYEAKKLSKKNLVFDREVFTDMRMEAAYGFAMFDAKRDAGIYETLNRADDNMYKMKRWMKKSHLVE